MSLVKQLRLCIPMEHYPLGNGDLTNVSRVLNLQERRADTYDTFLSLIQRRKLCEYGIIGIRHLDGRFGVRFG